MKPNNAALSIQELKQRACETIEQHRQEIIGVAQEVLSNPEPGFSEAKTSSLVSRKLSELGVQHPEAIGQRASKKGGHLRHRRPAER